MFAQEYWNTVGSKKEFEDPLYLEKLAPFLSPESLIVEYGCGYGRLMQILKSNGYDNLIGFDFAPNMIERGLKTYPHLNLQLLEKSGKIPCEDGSVDAVVMSTVLCCMVEMQQQVDLIQEILRVLKKGGGFYLSDFLICDHSRYQEKYAAGLKQFNEWGVYTTAENLTVRHHTTSAVMDLLEDFDIQWFEQFNFKTMNQNPARTFHAIVQK